MLTVDSGNMRRCPLDRAARPGTVPHLGPSSRADLPERANCGPNAVNRTQPLTTGLSPKGRLLRRGPDRAHSCAGDRSQTRARRSGRPAGGRSTKRSARRPGLLAEPLARQAVRQHRQVELDARVAHPGDGLLEPAADDRVVDAPAELLDQALLLLAQRACEGGFGTTHTNSWAPARALHKANSGTRRTAPAAFPTVQLLGRRGLKLACCKSIGA